VEAVVHLRGTCKTEDNDFTFSLILGLVLVEFVEEVSGFAAFD
jgi:hypothetical protein